MVMANAWPELTVMPKGVRFYYFQTVTNKSGSGPLGVIEDFGEGFVNIVTVGITAVGLGVDFLSNLYEQVKEVAAQVVKTVITAVPGLGQLCSAHPAQCEAAIEAGITTGMMAMGMPPSLPNWDELKEQGVDYLAAEIASQTGVPPEVVDEALEIALEAVEQMTQKRGLLPYPGYSWLISYQGMDPAVLTIDVRKNDPGPLPNLVLRLNKSGPFAAGGAPIPRTFVAEPDHLRMPMVLHPNLAGIPPPLCIWDGTGVTGCIPQFFPSPGPACVYKVYKQGGYTYESFQCPAEVVAVYYRDAWIPKLASGCTPIVAVALEPAFVTVEIAGIPFVTFGYEVLPGYSFLVGAEIYPAGPFTWNGSTGSVCP
jgi:hypothetical protein